MSNRIAENSARLERVEADVDELLTITSRVERKLDTAGLIVAGLAASPSADDEPLIESAIDNETVLGFHYTRLDGEPTVRIVSPYEVRTSASGDHVVGYDHNREGLRQFAVERIERLTPLDFAFRAPEGDGSTSGIAPDSTAPSATGAELSD